MSFCLWLHISFCLWFSSIHDKDAMLACVYYIFSTERRDRSHLTTPETVRNSQEGRKETQTDIKMAPIKLQTPFQPVCTAGS